jgi:6-phosphogluconate dehydrogenase
MKIGMVGLGRIGTNLVRWLRKFGHDCVVYDTSAEARKKLAEDGAEPVDNLAALVAALPEPRTVWIMVPSGAITDQTTSALSGLLEPGDTLIDGGNSHFKTTVARASGLSANGIGMLDVGTSGGVFGLERGYCLMIGGSKEVVARHRTIFEALSPGVAAAPRTAARTRGEDDATTAEQGWLHCGPSGAGHYVKMVHNGIEYGMMQAFAEGFALLDSAGGDGIPDERRFDLDCGAIAELWRRGSVVTSWLLDLTADALAESPDHAPYSAQVQDSGEGRWTVEAAVEQSIPAPVLTAALFERFRSRQDNPFADKLISAMRYKFGGHTAPPKS